MKDKLIKIKNFIKKYFYYILATLGITMSHILISCSNDIEVIRNFSGIAFLFFILYVLLLKNSFQTVLYQYRKFLDQEINNKASLKYIKDKFESIVEETL